MAGFTAQGVVDALDFDFRPYVNVHGTIPEPTDRQIGDFLAGIKKIIEDAKGEIPEGVGDDPMALLRAMDDLEPDSIVGLMSSMCGAYAALCSGTPSAEQIGDLPMRVRQIFFNWLQTEVMSPEAATGDGRAPVRSLQAVRGA